MATSFTKAALGAEGIGKDVEMIIGNGYAKNHADITLKVLRESQYLREMYLERYVKKHSEEKKSVKGQPVNVV